jgi:hypothetical protein
MADCEDIKYCSISLLEKYKVLEKSKSPGKIVKLICSFIDKLIFNLASIISLICLKINIQKVTTKDIIKMKEFINMRLEPPSKSKSKIRYSGGVFNTAAFYGIHEPVYSINNLGSDVMSANISGGIARPALGDQFIASGGSNCNMLGGIVKFTGCKKVTKTVKLLLCNIFKYFKIEVDNKGINNLVLIFNKILGELFMKLKNIKGELNETKVKNVICKYKFMHSQKK